MDELRTLIAQFAEDRDWAQFHTPKSLTLALVGEVGELAAELQWQPDDAAALGDEQLDRLRDELADVAIYLIRLADVLGVGLDGAVRDKIALNQTRFPVPKWRGRVE